MKKLSIRKNSVALLLTLVLFVSSTCLTGFMWNEKNITIIVDGKAQKVMTTAPTVEDLAKELSFTGKYIAKQSDSTPLELNSEVTFFKVARHVVQSREEQVDIVTERRNDDTLPKGVEKLVQSGTPGYNTVKEEVYFDVAGNVIKSTVLQRDATIEMQPRIVAVGTKENLVATGSGYIAYKKVITMNASAYLATDGNGEGITATGIPAVYGVVAVDPNVIPLGTRLYIPGYGEAIAADTGGAIIGNHIDLVMNTYSEAMNFGRQNIEVYVL